MCTYCAKWFPVVDMTIMREKGKDYVDHYCDRCLPEVRSNIATLPWKDLYSFYRYK